MHYITEADHEKFNQWVFSISDTLESLITRAETHGITLSVHRDSLVSLERYILAAKVTPDDDHTVNELAQFLGEIFRLTHGGRWGLCGEESDINFNTPLICDFHPSGVDFDAIQVIRNFIYRPTEVKLERALDAHIM